MCNPDIFFCLLANCFVHFCSDFDVLIFPTLLADIQRPNWKLAQGPQPVNIELFNPCPVYSYI